MNKSAIIIDDVKDEWAVIATELKGLNCSFFPKKDNYSDFRSRFLKIISSTNKQEEIMSLNNWMNSIEIQPVLFIIDISLTGQYDNFDGLALGNELNIFYGNSVSIIYVSNFDISLIEGKVKKEDFVYKKELSIRLPEVLIDKGFVSFNNTSKDDSSSHQNDKSLFDIADSTRKYNQELTQTELQLKNKKLSIRIEKNKKKLARLSNSEYFLTALTNIFFKIIILSSVIFLLYYSLCDILYQAFVKPETISGFIIVEHLFLSPLPLIISITFYNFYIRILEPILQREKRDTSLEKRASMLDINISKYLFISILFSTLLVVMTEFIKKSTDNITLQKEISNSKLITIDSLSKLSDTVKLGSIYNLTVGDLRNHPIKVESSDNFIITFIFSGVFLFLLVFYLFKLEKNISEAKKY